MEEKLSSIYLKNLLLQLIFIALISVYLEINYYRTFDLEVLSIVSLDELFLSERALSNFGKVLLIICVPALIVLIRILGHWLNDTNELLSAHRWILAIGVMCTLLAMWATFMFLEDQGLIIAIIVLSCSLGVLVLVFNDIPFSLKRYISFHLLLNLSLCTLFYANRNVSHKIRTWHGQSGYLKESPTLKLIGSTSSMNIFYDQNAHQTIVMPKQATDPLN